MDASTDAFAINLKPVMNCGGQPTDGLGHIGTDTSVLMNGSIMWTWCKQHSTGWKALRFYEIEISTYIHRHAFVCLLFASCIIRWLGRSQYAQVKQQDCNTMLWERSRHLQLHNHLRWKRPVWERRVSSICDEVAENRKVAYRSLEGPFGTLTTTSNKWVWANGGRVIQRWGITFQIIDIGQVVIMVPNMCVDYIHVVLIQKVYTSASCMTIQSHVFVGCRWCPCISPVLVSGYIPSAAAFSS